MHNKRLGYVVAWLVAATLAVAVGIAAVSTVGASIRGRGPLGHEVVRDVGTTNRVLTPDPRAEMRRDSIEVEFGVFEVGCRGVVAYGLDHAAAPGWSIVSFESGPDDDVDAVFRTKGRSVEVEVFCNQGEPTVAEIEPNTLPSDD